MRLLAEVVYGDVRVIFYVFGGQLVELCRHVGSHARSRSPICSNLTTNRLESTWNQIKSLNNISTSMDMFLCGVLLYMQHRLRELRVNLTKQLAWSVYDSNAYSPLKTLVKYLTAYSYDKIVKEYELYLRKRDAGSYHVMGGLCTSSTVVHRTSIDDARAINTDEWTCDCHYYVTYQLACSHVFFVLLDHLKRKSAGPEVRCHPRCFQFVTSISFYKCLRFYAIDGIMRRQLI